jgi:hypothetical protein
MAEYIQTAFALIFYSRDNDRDNIAKSPAVIRLISIYVGHRTERHHRTLLNVGPPSRDGSTAPVILVDVASRGMAGARPPPTIYPGARPPLCELLHTDVLPQLIAS